MLVDSEIWQLFRFLRFSFAWFGIILGWLLQNCLVFLVSTDWCRFLSFRSPIIELIEQLGWVYFWYEGSKLTSLGSKFRHFFSSGTWFFLCWWICLLVGRVFLVYCILMWAFVSSQSTTFVWWVFFHKTLQGLPHVSHVTWKKNQSLNSLEIMSLSLKRTTCSPHQSLPNTTTTPIDVSMWGCNSQLRIRASLPQRKDSATREH